MATEGQPPKPIVFTTHARKRMRERGAREEDVREAIRVGQREPAQRGLVLYRLNLEMNYPAASSGVSKSQRLRESQAQQAAGNMTPREI